MTFELPHSGREQVWGVCQKLLEPNVTQELSTQIRRVLCYITNEEQWEAIREPRDVIAAFKTRGLLPGRLLTLCRGFTDVSAVEPVAVGFAACVYPHRAARMGDTELTERLRLFLQVYRQAVQLTRPDGGIFEHLSPYMTPNEIKILLADLSSAHHIPERNPQQTQLAMTERTDGAALYLAHCNPERLGEICEYWRHEAGFIRYLRTYLPSPPTRTTRQELARWPVWSSIEAQLTADFPDVPAEYHQQATILEYKVWKEAAKWLSSNAPDLIAHRVQEYWELQFDKLISGFPFYAFRSRFIWWWGQCLEHYSFTKTGVVPLQDGAPAPVEPPSFELTLEQLRWFREGYRLVRTTFFRRADEAAAPAGDPTDPAEADERVAEANDRVRAVVDELWWSRLANQIGEDLPLSREQIQEIATRFPDFDPNTLYIYSHRLRLRIWAYALARLGKLSNEQVRRAKRPPAHARRGATVYPLYNEPGVLTIASLARTVPPRHTLLWAFTAHVFLHPKVEPQRPDPWNFKRYVRELWSWVTDVTFDDTLLRGAEEGSRTDKAATAVLETAPCQDLLKSLQRCETEADLEHFLLHAAPDLLQAEEVVRAALDNLLGATWRHPWQDRAVLRDWKNLVGRSGYHWIVPVWFLTVVEQLDEQRLLSRLQVDEAEEKAVVSLSRAMRAVAARHMDQRGGGGQADRRRRDVLPQPVQALQSGRGGQQMSAEEDVMDRAEAKKIIATYLTGRFVRRQDLERACELVRSDAQYVQYLTEELRMHADWGSPCEAFLSHLAEFSHMTPTERQQQMPTSLAHVEACPSCHQAYWRERPLWTTVVDATVAAKTLVKRLSEHISLSAGPSKGLQERGCGPLSRLPALLAPAIPTLGAEEPEQKEWVLHDEDGTSTIRLVVSSLQSGSITVSCTLQSARGTSLQGQRIRLEVRKAENNSLVDARTLRVDQPQPIQLRHGSWVLKLEVSSPAVPQAWEIPLDIDLEPVGEGR